MNFDFSKDQEFLRDEARKFLVAKCPTTVVRRVLEGPDSFHAPLWQEVTAMGWAATAISGDYGGQGAGPLELCILAEEIGRSLAPIPFSSSVYLAAELLLAGGSEEQKRNWLPMLTSGSVIGTLAWNDDTSAQVTADGNRLTGTKLPVTDGDVADLAVVTVGRGAARRLFLVDLTGPGIERTAVESIDGSRSQARVRFDGARAEALGDGSGADVYERVLDRAGVFFAFEQLGGAQAALEMGTAYAKGRYAFGRPIGSFQAIKHMLADVYCAVELARANAYYGAWAVSTNAPDVRLAAATARVSAIEAFELAATQNIQVHGGMGFTWELDCHLYYRRAKLLTLVLGTPSFWKRRLTRALLSHPSHAA